MPKRSGTGDGPWRLLTGSDSTATLLPVDRYLRQAPISWLTRHSLVGRFLRLPPMAGLYGRSSGTGDHSRAIESLTLGPEYGEPSGTRQSTPSESNPFWYPKVRYVDDGHGCVEGVPYDYDDPSDRWWLDD